MLKRSFSNELLIHSFKKCVILLKTKVVHNGSKSTDTSWGKNKS